MNSDKSTEEGMAKGMKTGGRDFPPGVSGNPNGAPRMDTEEREVRRLTKDQVSDFISLVLLGQVNALEDVLTDSNSTVFRKWLAKAATNGIQSGDLEPLDRLLSRIVGKPKQPLEHSGVTLEDMVAGSRRTDDETKGSNEC